MDINKLTPVGAINKKHLLSLSGYTEEDICEILLKARELAQKKAVGEKTPALKNRYALLITKRSFSRSRIAFEVAVSMLQGSAIVSTLHGSELETMITISFLWKRSQDTVWTPSSFRLRNSATRNLSKSR